MILGEGGNTSLACIATDAAFFIAKSVFENLTFCNDDIDSVELEASYKRLEHVHGDIEALQSKLGQLADTVQKVLDGQTEQNLLTGLNPPSLERPAAMGGRLEKVRDLVRARIAVRTRASADAGKDTARAESLYAAGERFFADDNYRCAYRLFALAYRALAGRHGDDDDVGGCYVEEDD